MTKEVLIAEELFAEYGDQGWYAESSKMYLCYTCARKNPSAIIDGWWIDKTDLAPCQSCGTLI